jgi:hypothetical protein
VKLLGRVLVESDSDLATASGLVKQNQIAPLRHWQPGHQRRFNGNDKGSPNRGGSRPCFYECTGSRTTREPVHFMGAVLGPLGIEQRIIFRMNSCKIEPGCPTRRCGGLDLRPRVKAAGVFVGMLFDFYGIYWHLVPHSRRNGWATDRRATNIKIHCVEGETKNE